MECSDYSSSYPKAGGDETKKIKNEMKSKSALKLSLK